MSAIWLKALPYIAALLIGATGAWMWQANSYGEIISGKEKTISDNKAMYQADLTMIANAGAVQARQAVEKQQVAEQALADLDAKNLREKNDGISENESLRKLYGGLLVDNARLRNAVDAGDRRLRIAGACTNGTSGADVPKTASTAGMGDAGSVELSAASGSTVFDIRAGIIADQAALRALQEYVMNVCGR